MSHVLALVALFTIVLVALDLAAYRWGADSRPGPNDRPEWW